MNSISDKNRPFWKLTKSEQVIMGMFLIALLLGSWLPSRLIVAVSDSLDHRIFLKVKMPSEIRGGDYLLFELSGEGHRKHLKQGLRENNVLIKRVACGPGDVLVRYEDGTFTCNNFTLGAAMENDSKGRRLPVFDFTGPVPEDCYFMVGTNPRSYDSRYFGFIHANEFLSKALPLW